MPQTPRRSPRLQPTLSRRPVQDITTVKQQAGQFPSVGMTLRSYAYDPRDYHRGVGARGTIVKRGFFERLGQRLHFKRLAMVFAVLALIAGGWLGGKFLYNAHKLFGGNILGILSSTKLRGEDQGRVNILLAGNSADDPGHSGAKLTDSIMVVSLDTKNNKAFLLSVPRDLWVRVPGDGHEKINAAYLAGEASKFSRSGYPEGGMGMLEQIVSENLGIPIHYYALIDYNAFRQAVDAVGGIDIVVKSNDPRGLYDPNIDWQTKGPLVKLSNGPQHLNGRQALDLARARGDSYYSYGFAGSDFTRTEHQRQMLVALKNKAISAGVLANPARLSSLSDSIGNNVTTDFKVSEVRRLYDISRQIDSSQIKSLSLNNADGKNLLTSYTSPRGESALIPALGVDNFTAIKSFLRRQTSTDPVVQESATVVVLNATDISGLATKARTKLAARNLTVVRVGDAAAKQSSTTIIDNSGGKKPASSRALMQLYGSRVTTANPYANLYTADFIVVLGSDQTTGANSGQ